MKRRNQILTAIATVSVLTTASGITAFAAEETDAEAAVTAVVAEAEEKDVPAEAIEAIEAIKPEIKNAKDLDLTEIIDICKDAFDFTNLEFTDGPAMNQFIEMCRDTFNLDVKLVPAAPADGELPEPPAPPVDEDGEKPEPPKPHEAAPAPVEAVEEAAEAVVEE